MYNIRKEQEHKKHGKGDRKIAQGPRKRVKVLKMRKEHGNNADKNWKRQDKEFGKKRGQLEV